MSRPVRGLAALLALALPLAAQMPKWLQLGAEYRARYEGTTGIGFTEGSQDHYLLSRYRVSLKLLPVSWLKFYGQVQDARVYGRDQQPPPAAMQDSFDLRQAYVELGDIEKKPFGIRVGRQELNFGEQRLLGSANWGNSARTFDAARLTVRGGGLRLDAFTASAAIARDGEWNHHRQGDNLHGLEGAIERLVPKAVIEPYLLWRIGRGVDFKTTGVRWNGKLPRDYDYNIEIAHQTGGQWGGHWVAGRTLTAWRYHPRLFGEYNYATPGFDNLYPTPHEKYGLADQVGWKNIHHLRAGPEFKLHAKWSATAAYNTWWLADTSRPLYNAGGAAIARLPAGARGRRVGQEAGGQIYYTYNRHARVYGGIARVFPGAFLRAATPGHPYTFSYLSMDLTY